uniref:Uncharacterized protein n=1 Tax=Oryza punctata TaxID=4537 RepID=A0A0E0M7F6_ORYPU
MNRRSKSSHRGNQQSICSLSIADGATAEDPIFGTEVPVTENHGVDQVQEDIDIPVESNDVDPMQEDLLNEIYNKEPQISAVGGRAEETTPAMAPKEAKPQDDSPREAQDQLGKIQLTEEQRACMEANRLRALEWAAAAHFQRAEHPSMWTVLSHLEHIPEDFGTCCLKFLRAKN